MAMFVAEMYAYREKEATAVWEGYKRIPTQLLGEVIVESQWVMDDEMQYFCAIQTLSRG